MRSKIIIIVKFIILNIIKGFLYYNILGTITLIGNIVAYYNLAILLFSGVYNKILTNS